MPRTEARTACNPIELGSGLDVIVLGSGGPRAAGRAAASYVIAIGGTPRYMIDAGSGSFTRLGESGLETDRLDTILLTHLHIDHAGDVPDLVKSRDLLAKEPLRFRIVGPSGRGVYPSTSAFVDRLLGPHGAFAYLSTFRNPLTLETTDIAFDLERAPETILEEDGVKISAAAVDHRDVPAVAYRIDYRGQSVVISGDLASRRGQIATLARGATVLVYDAAVLAPPGSPAELYELHTPPARIGEVASQADVGTLILSHIPPAVEAEADAVLASVRAAFRGDVMFARDCLHLRVGEKPQGSAMEATSSKHRVLFELTSEDPKVWEGVLHNVENVRKALGAEATEVEVVAHGKGLGLLIASTTPVAARVSQLAQEGVVFAACQNTMKKMHIDKSQLLPAATTVDSGVAEVVRKQEAGWSYLKGG
ncbi:hypothetical protein BH11MYX3_BH11MYX3_34620 [soil metagenome]